VKLQRKVTRCQFSSHGTQERGNATSSRGTHLGLKGLPDAINAVWELAVVQTCIVHLIRNTFRYAARQYWDEMSRDLRPVYTAPSEAAAKERFVAAPTPSNPSTPATVGRAGPEDISPPSRQP
jgi:transposase-like protein